MLVLIERSKPPFLPRLLAELGSSGFDVAVVAPSTFPPGRPEIEQLAQREGATVELLVVEAGAGLEIWIVDPSTGKTVFREVILGMYEPREAPELVAIRLVETFRATLLDFASPHTSAPPIPLRPVPPVDSSTHAGPSRFTIAVGGGGAYSAGGIGPTAHLDLALGYRIGQGFSIAVDGALTPARTRVRGAAEGEAEVAWYLAGVSLGFSPGDPAAPIRFRSSAGAWIGWMSLTGQPIPPYVNTPAEFVSVIPHLGAGLRFSLTPSVALGADLSLGVSAPGASIRFAGREVATWGRPLWMGSLALEAALDR